MKSLFRTLTLASALVLSAQAMAGDNPGPRPGHGGPEGPGMMPLHMLLKDRVSEKLALTDTQKAQIKSLLEAHKGERPSRDEMKAKMAEFKALMEAPSFDENKARALLEERVDHELDRMKLGHDVMQVLTQEQRDKLADMREKMMSRHLKKHD